MSRIVHVSLRPRARRGWRVVRTRPDWPLTVTAQPRKPPSTPRPRGCGVHPGAVSGVRPWDAFLGESLLSRARACRSRSSGMLDFLPSQLQRN